MLLSILFLIPLVTSAVDTNEVDNVYQVNSIVDYSKPCINNGTFCSASTSCNYTLTSPRGEIKFNNSLATNQGSFHNHSMNFDEIGIWTIDMICCDPGGGSLPQGCGAETLYAEITGSGFNDTFGFYILIMAISVLIMGLGFWKMDAPMTLLGTFGLYFLGIYILINGIAGIRDVVTTRATGIIVLGVAMYVSARAAHELIVD